MTRVLATLAVGLFVCALTASPVLAATPPAVTTNPVDELTAHSARLNGIIDPAGNGEVTSCQFEYGPSETYSLGSVPCEPATPYANPEQVSAKIPGLEPEKTYHFRLIAANASPGSEVQGADQTFTTSVPTKGSTASFGGFNRVVGAGVDNSSNLETKGDVYVTDLAAAQVLRFTEEGTPAAFAEGANGNVLTGAETPAGSFAGGENGTFTVAVDRADGDFYVTDAGHSAVDKFSPSGKYLSQLTVPVTATLNGGPPGSALPNGPFHPWGVAVDPANGEVYVTDSEDNEALRNKVVDKFSSTGNYLTSFDGSPQGHPLSYPNSIAVDSSSNVYVESRRATVDKFNSAGVWLSTLDSNSPLALAIDPGSGEIDVTDNGNSVAQYDSAGTKVGEFGGGSIGCSFGLGINGTTHRAYVADLCSNVVHMFPAIPGAAVPDVGTGNARNVTRTSATLTGIVAPAGTGDITECFFEVSGRPNVPCEQPTPYSGSTEVTGSASGLSPGTTYVYHLVAKSKEGVANRGQADNLTMIAETPILSRLTVTDVHSDIATLHGHINANKAATAFHFEYVIDEQFQATGFADATSLPGGEVSSAITDVAETQQTGGLQPGSTYHFRLVATNSGGTSTLEGTFTTFSPGSGTDACPNAHLRQQTSASQLPDCRAYELVSAANTGGYNVESSLVGGQTPFGGYPQASGALPGPSRVLYAVHYGGIPDIGDSTNKGDDPYIAFRGKEGWNTTYVGIPASTSPSTLPFASSLLEADPSLNVFAFGGEDICSPCFEDGTSGIPVHLPNEELVQGMAGPLNPGPAAKPDGYIAKRFSADGTHFVFASTSQFAPGGNDETGDISVYDHNLKTGITQVVSKTQTGASLPCLQGVGVCHSPGDGHGIAELDMSSDGSHILLGQKVSRDAKGNDLFHLFMDVNDANQTIDVTPGAVHGVLFDGMTADGTKVFFTATDRLTADDTDSSADIYEVDLSDPQNPILTRISTGSGSTGNTDACNPADDWNSGSGDTGCSVVAIGGGGGVATGNGMIYFLSPEMLDGPTNGIQNQPNLYVARPGAAPMFVTTLQSVNRQFPSYQFVENFGTNALKAPTFVAVDNSGGPSNGDVYFGDTGDVIAKVDSTRHTAPNWGNGGVLNVYSLTNETFNGSAGFAVDSSGTLHVIDPGGNYYQIAQSGTLTSSFLGALQQGTAPKGLATDSSGHFLYKINNDGSVEKFDGAGNDIGRVTSSSQVTGLAVDPVTGDLYVDDNGTTILRYAFNAAGEVIEPNSGTCTPAPPGCGPSATFAVGLSNGAGLAVDPITHHIYVDEGDQIVEFETLGSQVGAPFGSGALSGSTSVAVDSSGNLYATNMKQGFATIAAFERLPAQETGDPVITDAISHAASRNYSDFQVSPDGNFAVFSSSLPLLPSVDNAGYNEVYRYDARNPTLDCVSCNPTGATDEGQGGLSNLGLGLTDNGRVFFESTQALVSADGDNKTDVYEWEPLGTVEGQGTYECQTDGGCVGLISTGTSRFDSMLLGASSDGTDAFFFTRDVLVPQDENGTLAKIYDARELGGFPFIPSPVPCKASDECHGPSSPKPPAPSFGSLTGNGGNYPTSTKCKHRRHGKCVRHSKPKHHRRARRDG